MPPSAEAIKEQITRELVRVQEDSYGETACNVEVVLHETFVAVVMDLELTPAEVTLIDSGYATSLQESRETYQVAIGDTYIAIVERATGRRVTSFASRSVIEGDRPWAIELFRLDDRPAGL